MGNLVMSRKAVLAFVVLGAVAAAGIYLAGRPSASMTEAAKETKAPVNAATSARALPPDQQQTFNPASSAPIGAATLPQAGNPADTMRSPEEVAAYLRALRQRKPSELWQAWGEALNRGSSQEFGWLVTALGYQLRTDPDDDVYRALKERVLDRKAALRERLAAVETLMFAASPQAASILVDLLRRTGPLANAASLGSPEEVSELAAAASRALDEASHTRLNGSRNWSLSLELEGAWSNPDASRTFSPAALRALAGALAYLARPEGVQTLVDATTRLDSSDPRHQAANNALSRMGGPDAVPVLGAALRANPGDAQTTQALLLGLLSVGNADAIDEILRFVDAPTTSGTQRDAALAMLERDSNAPAVRKALDAWRRRSGKVATR